MTRARSRFRLALLGLVVLGVAVRVAFLAEAARPLPDPGDAVAYHLLGEGLADGDGYVRPFDRIAGRTIATAEWGPAFPAFLAVTDLAGIDDLERQRRAAAALAALGIALTGLAGARVGGMACGLVAAAVVALHPLLVQHDTALLTETLALAAGAAVLVASSRFTSSRTVRDAALVGITIGAAALVRADALALLPTLAPALAWVTSRGDARGRRRVLGAARSAGIVVAVAVLVIAPWVVRNTVQLGRPVGISTNAATAVAGANCDVTYTGDVVGYWRFGPGCFLGYDTEELVANGEAAVAADHFADGVDFARTNADRVPAVVGARVLRLWGLWDLDEQVSLAALDEAKSPAWVRVGTVVGWGVGALACVGLALSIRRRRWPVVAATVAPAVAVTVAAALTYGNARFRAGAEPALAVLAAVVVTAPWRRS